MLYFQVQKKPLGIVGSTKLSDMAGPGTELKKLISYFAKDVKGCKCNDKAILMDKWGPDRCHANRTIIVSWLRKSARKRNMIFSEIVANALISLAIRRARRSQGK